MIGTRRALFYLVLVFLLGAALGALGTLWATKRSLADERRLHDRSPRGALERLDRELKLSPEQRRQLEAILDQTGEAYSAIRERARPEYEAARQSGREKIRAILSEQQRARFEELVREIDAREAERRQRRENQKR